MALTVHRWLCRCLAPDALCSTAELTSALDSPGFAWEPMLALAHRHLIAAPWYPALQRRGLLARAPAEVVEHLAALHAFNTERNALLRRELIRAARTFNAIGVEPLLLKGALALLPGQSPEVAARLMGDLDLLVPADRIAECGEALIAGGYYTAAEEDGAAASHHAPPLRHPDHGTKFELHRAVVGRSLASVPPVDDLWRDSRPVAVENVVVCVPSPTHRVLHNALHTLVQDRRAESGILELRQLLDLVQWRAREETEIDWSRVRARFDARSQGVTLVAYLLVAHDLFGQPLPAGCKPTLSAVWLAGKFLFGVRHPAAIRGYHWQRRLKRLPKRLLTPAWYSMKIRALRRGEPL